jgi:hypothetical protein
MALSRMSPRMGDGSLTSIHDLARQADWELEGVRRAIQRYREDTCRTWTDAEGKTHTKDLDPMTLPPGRALVRGVVKPLIEALKLKREEAAERMTASGKGRPPVWAAPVVALTSTEMLEKTAVITLNCAVRGVCSLTSHLDVGGSFATVTACALRLSEALRDQLEYDRWSREEAAEDKAMAGDEDYKSRLKALRYTYPNLNQRTWSKFCAKLEQARNGDTWDEDPKVKTVRTAVGALLLHCLVEAAPTKFKLGQLPRRGGGFQTILEVTPEAREVLNDVRERSEVARPLLMPMIIPPLPWAYESADPSPGPARAL